MRVIFLPIETRGKEICAVIGGEIQAWTITPEGISQRVIYPFNSYESDLHAGAAVAQRIMSGREIIDVAAGLVPTNEMRNLADDAAAADTAAAPVPGGTRAERRRAERAARKGARRAA